MGMSGRDREILSSCCGGIISLTSTSADLWSPYTGLQTLSGHFGLRVSMISRWELTVESCLEDEATSRAHNGKAAKRRNSPWDTG